MDIGAFRLLQDLDDLGVGVVPFGDELEFPFPAAAHEVANARNVEPTALKTSSPRPGASLSNTRITSNRLISGSMSVHPTAAARSAKRAVASA